MGLNIRKMLQGVIKHGLGFLPFMLGLYAVLCTVYSDVMVQNDSVFYDPRWALKREPNEACYSDILAGPGVTPKAARDSVVYLFLLDISGSLDGRLPNSLAVQYRTYIDSTRIHFGMDEAEIWECPAPTYKHLGTSLLYRSLDDLYQIHKRASTRDQFAVWTVGDRPVKLYPRGKFLERVRDITIAEAIGTISADLNRESKNNTDFASAFRVMRTCYFDPSSSAAPVSSDGRFCVVTILSDLWHDVRNLDKGKYADYDTKRRSIDEQWQRLEQDIQAVSDAGVVANLVVLSERDDSLRQSVFPIIKDNVDWYRLRVRASDMSERSHDFLYPVKCVQREQIRFYYKNPFEIDTSFVITSPRSNSIALDLPEGPGQAYAGFKLTCDHLGPTNRRQTRGNLGSRRIVQGNKGFMVSLCADDKISIRYTGSLPSAVGTPQIRVSCSEEAMTYLIPVRFIKVLPLWAGATVALTWLTLYCSAACVALSAAVLGLWWLAKKFRILVGNRWQRRRNGALERETPEAG